jgi:iduronate 2-sulfatase
MKTLFVLASLCAAVGAFAAGAIAAPPNVLFIASDDMRPQLGCYGDSNVKSPHLDGLAKRGMVFERSYVQQALCSPSRISMLSGRYPATTGIFEIGRPLRATMPDITTLPQHFKNNGYHTRSLGKIYHVGIDDDASWTIPAWHSKTPRYGPLGRSMVEAKRKDDEAKGIKRTARAKGVGFYAGPAFEVVDEDDEALLDGDTAANAIAQLREHAKNPSQPFFLGVGFANPHVPWVAPKKYWDLYDRSKLPLATNTDVPKGAPAFATTQANDFLSYANVPEGQLPEPFQRECLHGYLAAISYVDAQVGRLLAALDETDLAKNTIVVFWTDHGYYMGEHSWWGMKHNNYEGATRNALIISQPGMKQAGKKTVALAQAVDLAPTLTELCGLPKQAAFEGRSLKPVLEDPTTSVNEAAFSWYPKDGHLGVAMRTDKWRFVEWTKKGQEPIRELYDMTRDLECDVNLADDGKHDDQVAALSKQLRERFPVQEFKPPPAATKKK